MSHRVDLVIVGGGPIGLATALYGQRAGLDVLVVEPRSTPIDKPCGEGLMPSALHRLHDLGVDPPGRAIRGIRYLDANGHRQVSARFDGEPGRGVRRTELHQAMSDEVVSRGVRVTPGRMVELSQDAEGVTVVLASGDRIRARYAVGADGLHSRVRRAIGLTSSGSRRPRHGLRRHFGVAPWTDLVEVHWADDVEAYVTPVSQQSVGVALLTTVRGESWEQLLARFPGLRRRLGDGPPLDEVTGAGPLRQAVSGRVKGRVLLVGDAAGYVDALTGEGIAVGLASAQSATEAITANQLARYERQWRRVSRTSRWLTHGALFAAQHSSVRRAIVPSAQRLPSVFARVVNGLA